ncbi:hypothetical protein D1007_18919 [Hordeum vulgare]|nr:hypothetical protein D1007_18919 [Hordeum vulgare]
MASPSDAHSATSGSDFDATAKTDLGEFFVHLDLNDEVFEDVEIDEDDPELQASVRWLDLARVHTNKSFIPMAFYKDMRAAWNPAQTVRFRPVGPNRFVVQASCLGDWERIMLQGPWLFCNMAVLMCEYDGFSKAKEVEMVHMPIWLQIHKSRDPYCKQHIVEKLLKGAGEIMEMRLNGNTRGDYVRVRVKHDTRQAPTKFVSIVRAGERQVFLVLYEKLARFCKVCGFIGHEHKECGLGIHDKKALKYGDWLYADNPSRPRQDSKPSRAKGQESTLNGTPKKGKSAAEFGSIDPETADTASSPVKIPGARMEIDKDPRKRLNMDGVNPLEASGNPKALLAITDGSGNDHEWEWQ